MIPLAETASFRLWVANAVLAMSGIYSKRQSGASRKRALTCAVNRVVACQEDFSSFFSDDYRALARPKREVTTNHDSRPRILH